MTTALTAFEHDTGWHLRTIEMDGSPWFVAHDVCSALGLGRHQDSTRYLDDDEKGVCPVDTPSGRQQMTVVNEPGLYSLVLRSRKPTAKVFKRWITHEVLPAIRQTGSYSVAPQVPQTLAEALRLAADVEEARVAAEARALAAESEVQELAPKAEAHDAFLSASDDSLTFAEVARSLGYGRNVLFRELRRAGVLQRSNLPYRQYDHHFEVVLGTHYDSHGVAHVHSTTKVRPSGVDFIRRKLSAGDAVEWAKALHPSAGVL